MEKQSHSIPEQGQLVRVRERQWVVGEVSKSSMGDGLSVEASSRPQHFITLSSIEEDALGEECRVIWEIEPGARILERAGLPTPTGFDDPIRLDAFLDAVRWGAVTNADFHALHSPFRSGISLEDYQLDPVVRTLQMPRANLLIADDVGLGKTIEAGLVLQELLLRHRARSMFIVCPASLQIKWRDEMSEKFGLEFRIVDTSYLKHLRRARGIHTNPWTSFPRLIVSIDWLKNEIPMRLMRDVLPNTPTYPRTFDVLVVDEAHNVAPSGGKNYAVASLRTKAIRAISQHFEHRLFLTATPHNGYQESFTSLLELLDSQRFATGVDPDEKALRKVMVRRLKSDIVDENGNPVFPKRVLRPLEIDYTGAEREAHTFLVEYTKQRQAAIDSGGWYQATNFVLKLLKKRLFSSPAAFAATLRKHRQTSEGKKKKSKETKLEKGILRRAIQRAEEDYADDEAFEEALDGAVETASVGQIPLSEKERKLLDKMSKWADTAQNKPDSKANAILKWLKANIKPNGEWSANRVIIFTEYRATQKWLIDILIAAGFGGSDRLMTIYGGMDPKKREAVKAAFQTKPSESDVRILVATDAASEGIDLQNYCSMMIHAEIPWNPNVLEQRNGRIDRHGQKEKEVIIWHPVGSTYKDRDFNEGVNVGDIEGDLEFLMRAVIKVDAIRKDLGKVGPVIAAQVEEAMLGKRTTLNTAVAEEEATAIGKQLTFERELDQKVSKLHQRLVDSRDAFRLSPKNVLNAVRVALELAGLPPLKPTELSGAPSGDVFWMPAFQGTWALCAEGLTHPYSGKLRPVTFDHDIAKGRDDVVLLHLNHRLVQMCLRLLRAEVWALDDVKKLNRVTVRSAPKDVVEAPTLVAWARIVVTGVKGHRLHEEVISTGGLLREGKFSRLNVTETKNAIGASLDIPPAPQNINGFLDHWPKIQDSVMSAIEARSRDREKNLQNTLNIRKEKEIKDITETLEELKKTIEKQVNQPEPRQLELWPDPEREQLKKNMDGLKARLEAIPKEIEDEIRLIEERYADRTVRTFPVALTYLVPEDAAGRFS